MRRLLSLTTGIGIGVVLGGIAVRRLGAVKRMLSPVKSTRGSASVFDAWSERFTSLRDDARSEAVVVEAELRRQFAVPALDDASTDVDGLRLS